MSIASNRSRRANAGSKMNDIAKNGEDDEFYKKTYGGFVEEENDNDFEPENSEDEATEKIKNGESGDLDDKEHPPAKRLKTDAKVTEEVDSDEDDEEDDEEDEEDDEDEDDDDEGEDDEEDDDEEDAEAEAEVEADEDEDEDEESLSKEPKAAKESEPEAIPEGSKAE